MEIANVENKAIPVTVLTGFLGAGKTTLLNRIINGDHGLRIAVLVNDFGSINIDAELVVGVEDNMISLGNGCVCCQIRDDLIQLPANIYRAKGVIYTADVPNKRAILQLVGRRVDVTLFDEWGQHKPKTQIIAIGAKGSIDAKMLKQSFDMCTV